MANERLRGSLIAAGVSVTDLAAHVEVDPKTVERWITKARTPHRTHRWSAAKVLATDEAYLWPEVVDDVRTQSASRAELVTLYPHRGAVPKDLWGTLLSDATDNVDVLVYAGLFLPDGHPELAKTLAEKAKRGTRIRFLLGDPESDAVRQRGDEEGIDEGMAARVRLSLAYLADAFGVPGVEFRMHTTTLYNSIYRFDENLLVNTHTYGAPAAHSPVMHLVRVPGGRLFDHYQSSFDRVWAQAKLPEGVP